MHGVGHLELAKYNGVLHCQQFPLRMSYHFDHKVSQPHNVSQGVKSEITDCLSVWKRCQMFKIQRSILRLKQRMEKLSKHAQKVKVSVSSNNVKQNTTEHIRLS